MRQVCTAWRYENDHLSYAAVLWECDHFIKFQSLGEVTDWHGSWRHEDPKKLVLKFQYAWKRDSLGSVVLYNTAPGRWEGYDYLGRGIVMKKLRSFTWYEEFRCWG